MTREIVVLPPKCVTAHSLRALATSLERLSVYHLARGGNLHDHPCLTHVEVEGNQVVARVSSGSKCYTLAMVRGGWEMR